MAVFDNDLMFRTTGALTAKETKGPIILRGTPVKGLTVRISVPANASTTKTLTAQLYVSNDNSTYVPLTPYESNPVTIAAAAGADLILPLATSKKYVKLEIVPGGGAGGCGVVVAGIVPSALGFDFKRTVDWS